MYKDISNIINVLTKEDPCPEVWKDRSNHGYPESELGYFRCDHDGYKWWNTVWPLNDLVQSPELIEEFDRFKEQLLSSFPDLKALTSFCRSYADPASNSDTEFNMYASLDYGFYWIRMITRKGDYNMYIHCISKNFFNKQKDEQVG